MRCLSSLFFALMLNLVTFTVRAEITEAEHISAVTAHLQPGALVIFDIDNTLIRPAQHLGSDQWFRYQKEKYRQAGLKDEEALQKALSEWMSVQAITEVQLVEQEAAPLLASLQKKGYTVMGLTTRCLDFSFQTAYQLRSVGINLAATAPLPHDIFFNNGQGVLYRGGILYTAGSDKGKALEVLLERTGITPSCVIFVNDKGSHLLPIQEMCARFDIPFHGLRYSACDAWVAQFDSTITDTQFFHFVNILTDYQARTVAAYGKRASVTETK